MKLEDITPGYWWWNNGCNDILVKVYDDDEGRRYMTRFGCGPMWLFPACFAIKYFVRTANVS